MTQQHDETATLPPPPPAPPVPQTEPAAPKVRSTLGLPVVGAIAGAALVIGLLAGGIIGYAVHSDGPDFAHDDGFAPGQRFQQGGPGDGTMPQPPNFQPQGGS